MNKTALAFVAAAAALLSAAARADGHGPRVPPLPAYQQECAACHVAYPPGMLPKASWQRLMGNLPRHFGTDASLDAPTLNAIGTWLDAHAGSSRRVAEAPPEDRITRSAWFEREHRKVPAEAWKRASIRSAANCAACHTGAAEGDFDEDRVRIPK
ncbi:MAG: diheme cytochrome c [Pseudomonadota bacterium]